MGSIPEQMRELASTFEQMSQKINEQQGRIDVLSREVEQLRRERDEYRESLNSVLRSQAPAQEAEVNAQLDPATRTGVNFEQLMESLPDLFPQGGETTHAG